MIVLRNTFGQTSNRFFQHIHLDSFSRENGKSFFNPFLYRYYQIYPGLRPTQIHQSINTFIRFLRKTGMMDFFHLETFNDSSKDDLERKNKLIRKSITFVEGWQFRSFETTIRFRSHYQVVFDPMIDKQKFLKLYKYDKFSDQYNIAVHIRRGDYQYYKHGQYLYSDDQYIAALHSLLASISERNPHLVIFSNDRQLSRESYQKAFNSVTFSMENEFVDYYLMSKCNCIIGPPSTFSLWASYIGETPCYHIKNPEKMISPDDFQICSG